MRDVNEPGHQAALKRLARGFAEAEGRVEPLKSRRAAAIEWPAGDGDYFGLD
jgi:hypothetical protein